MQASGGRRVFRAAFRNSALEEARPDRKVPGITCGVCTGVGVSAAKVGSGFASPAGGNGIFVDVADGAGLVATLGVSCPPLVKLGMLHARMADTVKRTAIIVDLLFFFFMSFLLVSIMRSYGIKIKRWFPEYAGRCWSGLLARV